VIEDGVEYDAKTSENRLYVTLGEPMLSSGNEDTPFETLYSIGCNAAAGASTEQATFELLWSAFEGLGAQRADGTPLGYYQGIDCPDVCPVTGVEGLIRDANGQCGAMVRLLMACMATQGMIGSELWNVIPLWILIPDRQGGDIGELLPYQGYGSFLVENYGYTPPGTSGLPIFPFKFDDPCVSLGLAPFGIVNWGPGQAEAIDLPGIPAQTSADPASIFTQHTILRWNDQFWDPSYGVGGFPAAPNEEPDGVFLWEDSGTVSGFVRAMITIPGVEARPVVRRNTIGVNEMAGVKVFPPDVP